MELLKVSKIKRTLKFIKKRMGTHIHTKRKREELSDVLAALKKAFLSGRNIVQRFHIAVCKFTQIYKNDLTVCNTTYGLGKLSQYQVHDTWENILYCK